jgi:hypothetical protein
VILEESVQEHMAERQNQPSSQNIGSKLVDTPSSIENSHRK